MTSNMPRVVAAQQPAPIRRMGEHQPSRFPIAPATCATAVSAVNTQIDRGNQRSRFEGTGKCGERS
jgi:hypothetical protein